MGLFRRKRSQTAVELFLEREGPYPLISDTSGTSVGVIEFFFERLRALVRLGSNGQVQNALGSIPNRDTVGGLDTVRQRDYVAASQS